MKTCFKCGSEKELSEFYKHKGTADGHLGKCKDCTKRDSISNRKQRSEYYQEYEKMRSQQPHRKALAIRIHQEYKQKYPERRKAHEAVNNAVRDGRLIPQACCVCGAKGEAHHPDYSHPLEVVWLCSKHHKEIHHSSNPF